MKSHSLKLLGFSALTMAVSATSFAYQAGFEAGGEFTVTKRVGYLDVYCDGMSDPTPTPVSSNKLHYCTQHEMEPVQTSRLIISNDDGSRVQGTKVKVKVTHQDGSSRSRSKDFDVYLGKSDAFTLWNKSDLFTWPVLEVGTNRVEYTLKNSGSVTAQGSFEVQVHDGGVLECPDEKINSRNSSDCESSFWVCDQYFKRHSGTNSCRPKNK